MESRTDPGQLKGKRTILLITLAPTLSHLQPLGHPCSVSNMLTCSCLRDQTANIRWIIEKAREFQKNIYFCFIDYAKAFGCVDHNKMWKILQEMGIPDHLNCLLRNLYTGQEATVRTGHGTRDWFQIWKGICQGCILSPCLFKLYAKYINVSLCFHCFSIYLP